MILISSGNTSWGADSIYLVIGASSNLNKVCFGIYNTSDVLVATNTLTEGYNEVTLYRKDKILYLNVNGVITINNRALSALPFNYNASSNTAIGKNLWASGSSEIFKGSIYSIKVLRNTTDLTLLENPIEEEEPEEGGNVSLPLSINMGNITDQYNPPEGTVLYVTGLISNASALPNLVVTINGVSVNSSYVNVSPNSVLGDYDYSIGILTDGLEGEQIVIVTVTSDGEEAVINRSFNITRDVYLNRTSILRANTS
mgnify:FL=1